VSTAPAEVTAIEVSVPDAGVAVCGEGATVANDNAAAIAA
jgi:hypothetical protein